MDQHPVTVREFRRFVRDHRARHRRRDGPGGRGVPGRGPPQLVPGSLVFTPPSHPVRLDDYRAWWSWMPAAQWRRPQGPGSTLDGLEQHPVTHVAYADASRTPPGRARSCHRGRVGVRGARRARGGDVRLGDELAPRGRMMANTWQGRLPAAQRPARRLRPHLPRRLVRAERLRPRGHGGQRVGVDLPGLHQQPRRRRPSPPRPGPGHRSCCGPHVPRPVRAPAPAATPRAPRKVIKGGSHLCAPNYCLRYRPAAARRRPSTPPPAIWASGCIIRCVETHLGSKGEAGPWTRGT